MRLWSVPWGLAVPAGERAGGGALEVVERFRGRDWIVNSRSTADETVVRSLASMAGFVPAVTHRADDLDLLQDLVLAGLGVGLLPANHPLLPGVALLPLRYRQSPAGRFIPSRSCEGWPSTTAGAVRIPDLG